MGGLAQGDQLWKSQGSFLGLRLLRALHNSLWLILGKIVSSGDPPSDNGGEEALDSLKRVLYFMIIFFLKFDLGDLLSLGLPLFTSLI